MLLHVTSALTASAVTALVFVALVVPSVQDNWHAQGKNEGRVEALLEVSVKLQAKVRNDPANCSDPSPLFDVKTSRVQVVQCSGIKTVQVQQ